MLINFSKKGQVTIFVIMGIILISVISIIFFREGIVQKVGLGKEINPNEFLKTCLEEEIKITAEKISFQGGQINPALYKTFKFQEDTQYWNISYLCYNQGYYESCINQNPLLIKGIEKEIEKEIREPVENCFDELVLSLEKENYEVQESFNGISIDLIPKRINLDIEGELILTKTEETSKIKNFEITFPSLIYDLANVAQEIVAQEAKFCYFNNVGFSHLYPQFGIDIYKVEDTEIYTVNWRENQNKFRFAVKGCRL